jgi:hypothetical protein
MRNTTAAIREAFDAVPVPGTIRDIAPHECLECDELATALLNRPYHELQANVVDHFYESLPLQSPQALHHYLPAWLLRALENPGADVMEFTIYHLSPSPKSMTESKEYFEDRFSVFDRKQREAIADFFLDVEEYQLWVGHEGELERAKALWTGYAQQQVPGDAPKAARP